MESLFNLVGLAVNRGRTPEASWQRERELYHAKEKARVLKQRPPPRPMSRRALTQISLSPHSQPSSPLFTILPPEIRQRIYIYILGGSIILLTHIYKRLISRRLEIICHQINDEEPPTGDIPLQMPPTVDWQNEWDDRQHAQENDHSLSTATYLLQTCHAIYTEAVPVLYNSNTFSMSSPLVLLYLKDYVLLPQRFNQIRHLQLMPWVYFDDPEHHLQRVHKPYDEDTWPRFWDIVAEMDLRSLGLWVEYCGKEEDCSLDADWIRPLLKVRDVKKVGIQLQLRAAARDTKRLRDLEEEVGRIWTSSC